jgi:hypothetical protein
MDSAKHPFDEMSIRRNGHSVKWTFGEMASAKWTFGEIGFGEMAFGEMSGYG